MNTGITSTGAGTTENLGSQHFLTGMLMGAVAAAILEYVFPGFGIIGAIILPIVLAVAFRKQPQDPQDQKKQGK